MGSSNWLHSLGPVGVYIGLTGVRLKGADLLATGLATHYVPSDRLPRLEERLVRTCTSNAAANESFINEILEAESGASRVAVGGGLCGDE